MGLWEIIRSANHNLLRNKARTFLTILAIFIGSFTIALNSAINAGVNAFIDDQTASLGGEDYLMVMADSSVSAMDSMMMSGNSDGPREYNPDTKIATLTDEELEKLKTIDGIDGENIYVPKQIPIEYVTSKKVQKKYTITVSALPPGDFHIALTAGRLPDHNAEDYEIAIEPGYAEALGYDSDDNIIGQTIELVILDPLSSEPVSFTAKVVGTQAKGVVAVAGALINSALEDAMYNETVKYYPPDVLESTTAYVVETRYDTEKYTEQEIKNLLEENGFYGMTVSDMMGAIRTFFDVILIVFTIFGGIALLAAAIGIINTLLMSVEERTREIGLDKALGMSSSKIFANFSLEAIALGFWGSAFGVVLAMLVGYAVDYTVHQPGQFLEVFPTFELFKFTIGGMLPIIITVMVIAFVAGTVPAWKAAHKNPIDALRYE